MGENKIIESGTQAQAQAQVLTSMEVAGMLGKEHHKLLRDIRNYVKYLDLSKIGYVEFFESSTYIDTHKQTRPCFFITKKGCEFIAHKLTGIKGAAFTAKYINRFHDMEGEIAAPGMVGGDVGKLLKMMEQQNKLLAEQGAQIFEIKDRIEKMGLIRGIPAPNPFDGKLDIYEARRQKLDKMVHEIADIWGTDSMKVLHLLYQAIAQKYSFSLDTYREKLEKELDRRCTTFDVILYTEWIYKEAEQACRKVIEEEGTKKCEETACYMEVGA